MLPVVTWLAQALLVLAVPMQTPADVTVVSSYWNYQAAKTRWDIVGYSATGAGPLPLVTTAADEISPFPFANERAFGYMVEKGERVTLFKYDLATGQNAPLGIELQRGVTCAVSPDGKRLACSDKIGLNYQIVVYDLATRNREVVTNWPTVWSFDPSWSPDGRKLAYWVESSNTANVRIGDTVLTDGDHLLVHDFEAKRDVVLTNSKGVSDQYPRWSPDGQWIAFSRMGKQAWNIWMVRPDATGATELTTGAREDSFPAWSPDGRTIVFQSYRTGSGGYLDVYSVDVATKNVTRLSKTEKGDEQKPIFIARQ